MIGIRAFRVLLHYPDLVEYPDSVQSLLRLEQFPRGIDNVHIDVVLGQRFVVRATQLVRRLLTHEVSVNLWGEPPAEPAPRAQLNAKRRCSAQRQASTLNVGLILLSVPGPRPR